MKKIYRLHGEWTVIPTVIDCISEYIVRVIHFQTHLTHGLFVSDIISSLGIARIRISLLTPFDNDRGSCKKYIYFPIFLMCEQIFSPRVQFGTIA